MAKLILNRPLTLGGVNYPAGKHEVPDEHCSGWFYDALVEDGDIMAAGSVESLGEAELREQVAKLETRIVELERENEILRTSSPAPDAAEPERRPVGRPKKEQPEAAE
jgi:hypothetical protein